MEVTDVRFGEGTDIDDDGKIYRYKKARFRVNGQEHTLRISMSDFDQGRARRMIEAEADKIAAVILGKK